MDQPQIINGQLFPDVRGSISAWNEYNPSEKSIKRSYLIENREKRGSRRWHGHQKEEKYIRVLAGAASFACFPIEEYNKNDISGVDIQTFSLDSRIPSVLHIPAGFYHGFQSLEEKTLILVDSTFSLEESKKDDLRLDPMLFSHIWEQKYY